MGQPTPEAMYVAVNKGFAEAFDDDEYGQVFQPDPINTMYIWRFDQLAGHVLTEKTELVVLVSLEGEGEVTVSACVYVNGERSDMYHRQTLYGVRWAQTAINFVTSYMDAVDSLHALLVKNGVTS